MKAPRCPACPGFGQFLGSLGRLNWFRCRDCGIDFHRTRRQRTQRNPSAASARKRHQDEPGSKPIAARGSLIAN